MLSLPLTACMTVQAQLQKLGYTYQVQQYGVSAHQATCQKHFGHWCLDNAHISLGGIIAIIVVGSILVLACIALAAFLGARRHRGRKVLPLYACLPHGGVQRNSCL